jgi:hypothetical protein
MPAPLTPMDSMRPIDFTDALVRLHALIGADVSVSITSAGRFLGCGLSGRLDRVETFPPDNSAIKVVLEDGQGFFLDPADTDAFAGPVGDEQGDALELKLAFGVSLTVEETTHN